MYIKGTLISNLQEQINQEKVVNARLKKDCDAKDCLIRKLRKQIGLVKNETESLRSGNLPKVVEERTVRNVLIGNGRFTNAQVGQLLKPVKQAEKHESPHCDNQNVDNQLLQDIRIGCERGF